LQKLPKLIESAGIVLGQQAALRQQAMQLDIAGITLGRGLQILDGRRKSLLAVVAEA
jgi:hypothetical protein